MDNKGSIERTYQRLLVSAEKAGILVEDGSGRRLTEDECKWMAEVLKKCEFRGLAVANTGGSFKAVFIDPSLPVKEKVKTLAHELAHHFLHFPGYDAFSSPPHVRKEKEGQAERFSSWLVDFAMSMGKET